jgi:Zn-dependent M28 family amino/carboxypeptidase
MKYSLVSLTSSMALLILAACSLAVAPDAQMDTAMDVFETLTADDMQGRATGTPGGDKAREYLKAEIKKLDVFDKTTAQVFAFIPRTREGETATELEGTNLIGLFDTDDGDTGPLLVITAHYDHLGMRDDGEIYNGADDNASGSAALFAIAQSFSDSPPEHDVMLAWLDAEERGLQGARALVAENRFNGRPVFNLNLDMVSQNQSEIYYSGTYHYPDAKPFIQKAAKGTGLKVIFGNDSPADGPNDWTTQSDHGIFHAVGIPFGYFGVADHPYYHRPTDTYETIPQGFYEKSVQTLINAAHVLDENLDALAKPAESRPSN